MKSGNKTQKAGRDPYKLLLKVAGVLLLLTAVSAVVFLLCNAAVQSDYKAKRQAVDQLNTDNEQAFNAEMNTLRESASVTVNPETGEVTAVTPAYWDATLGGITWRLEDASAVALENISTNTVNRTDLLLGGLLLVNPWHSLPADFSDATLASVGNGSDWKIAVTDSNVKLFPAALTALENLVTAATQAGQNDYIVREAYRTNDEQTLLFNNQMEKLSSKYSGDVLIEQTKKSVNYPGTSEYQTGLSFRMALYNKDDPAIAKQKFQSTPQGQWFTENCWNYGIIFRFPSADYPNSTWEDKSYKTGMTLHLDLYRYVGTANAAAMKIMGYCLEEYVEFLIDHPHLYIYKDGSLLYEIYRITAADASTYDVPVTNPASSYTASLDNMGGIVLAYAYN